MVLACEVSSQSIFVLESSLLEITRYASIKDGVGLVCHNVGEAILCHIFVLDCFVASLLATTEFVTLRLHWQ